MSFMRVVVETNQAGATVARRIKATTGDKKGSIRRISDFLFAIAKGAYRGTVEVCTTAVRATATLTIAGDPTAGDTFVVCGVTFTARAAGATGDEFNITAGNNTAMAAAAAAAVNASASTDVTGAVTASSALGVLTFTAKVPGAIGNGLVLTESMDNTTRVDFAGGSDGTLTSLSAGGAS